MKKKKFYAVIAFLVVAVLLVIIDNIKIFHINANEPEHIYELIINEYNLENSDVGILSYDYVTGASWYVEKSTNKEIENEYVCLDSICNPRDLKINKDFELDYFAKYIVHFDKNIEEITIDDEDVAVLKTKETVISGVYYENDGMDNVRFGELTFSGKIKAIFALFLPELRLHI